MTLRVAVNLLWLSPGRVGGSEEYLVRQLGALADDRIEPTIYCAVGFPEAHPELAARWPTNTAPGRDGSRARRIALEHTWLAARTRGADVVHHGGGTTPIAGRGPRVLTVHDLQYLRFPEYFGRTRRTYLARMMPRSVRSAAVVATPTEHVRGTVVERFGIDPERVVVVPHGIPDLVPPTPAALADARARFGLADRPYVVYPAVTHPHKGHGRLVDMLAHVDDDLVVVLTGGTGAAEPTVRRAVAAHRGRLVRLGRVADVDRDTLVAGAAALVFPSEYEGFGAPLVEAMALRTPVVCSDAPAISEVVASAAIVVSDDDGEAWANGVREAIRRRDELVELGCARRRDFTTEVAGRALASAYRQAADA